MAAVVAGTVAIIGAGAAAAEETPSSANDNATACAEPGERQAGSDQSAQGETASAVSKTSTAATNDIETVRGTSANSQTARSGAETASTVEAGCIESTEHEMPTGTDACSLIP